MIGRSAAERIQRHGWPGGGHPNGRRFFLRSSSGNLARSAASRRASSRVSKLADERRDCPARPRPAVSGSSWGQPPNLPQE
jgi:hypothetical protein